ncbi:sensor histidine kinase [Streptomyces sp. MST-110588]|uniref:sensor histidine kinase n=1 Tax=Streptomyces sp. MST-110588 TaxID=2833628 RepID=UPI001F5E26AB|nr:sensor histidine kinase [Streptomyces sp. MST-110588]UNO43996.1 sensor histidine kinase [Streptomyces sp. MST-110588]
MVTAGQGSGYRCFQRWGGLVLLTMATVIAARSADQLMSRGQMYAAGALVTAAYALHVWWRVVGWEPVDGEQAFAGQLRVSEREYLLGQVYYVLRFGVAFALCWLNPYFGVYAAIGYVDTVQFLSRRAARLGLLGSAATLAGAASGGLPPRGATGWFAFLALFTVNSGLVLFFQHVTGQEAEHAAARAATIQELERTNARLEQAMAENAGLQAQLLAQAREAGINDERQRLAAEIHDTLAQGLTGIITQLQAATEQADPAVAREHALRAAELARHSLGEARRSVQDLGPGALEHDALPAALEKTVVEWSAAQDVRAAFTVTGEPEPLHEEVEATLLRIAQEALANVGRHAGASRVGVTLSYMEEEVTLDVRDDGRGFDPAAPPPRRRAAGLEAGCLGAGGVGAGGLGSGGVGAGGFGSGGSGAGGLRGGGFGIGGMRARAERIAGTVDVESGPGQGTAVCARVPLLVRHG